MSDLTRILILEDVPEDAELMIRELRQTGMKFESVCVSTKDAFLKELEDFSPNLILSDFSLPSYDGFTALEDHQRAGNGAPFIFVSGKMGEETVIEAMEKGATDYVLKNRLGRLAPAVQRALYEVEDHSKRLRAEAKILAQSEELKSINRELLILNRISAEISQTIDLDKMLYHALDTITDSGLYDLQKKGGILIAEGEKLNLAVHLGHDDKFLKHHENLTFDDCLCGLAARTGEIIISSQCSGDERHTIKYPGMEDHGHVIVPLKTANQVVGVLCLYLPAGAEINKSGRDLLQNIGSQLAISIENAKLYEETKANSLHDPLTGLANRSLMKNALKKAFAVSQRTGRPVSVIMLDLDHFKKYNDTYGHAAGDRLLVELAALISREIREIDVVARYGGEEFLAILPDTASEPATLVAERIRKTIELTEFFLSEGRQPAHMTVSLGVATYDVNISNEDMLVARADASLYRAKSGGRNRVEVWLPLL